MKIPRALIVMTGMLAAGLFFFGAAMWYAIRYRSIFGAISAGVAAASSACSLVVMDNICRLAAFSPREFFSVDKQISEFFSTESEKASGDHA